MRAYAAALDAKGDALPRLLDRYHVDVDPAAAGRRLPRRRSTALPGWERVYADASAVVHRRR